MAEIEQKFAERIRIANEQRAAALKEAQERAEAMLADEQERHNESMRSLELSFAVRSMMLGRTRIINQLSRSEA